MDADSASRTLPSVADVATTARPRPRRVPDRRANGRLPAVPQGVAATSPAKRGIPVIREELQKRVGVIASVIPKGSLVSAQGILHNALAVLVEDRHLTLCSPRSVLLSVLAAARFGFSFTGDDAYLIPYELTQDDGRGGRVHKEWACRFMAGYKGLIDLAARHGFCMYAQDVWECDELEITGGTHQHVEHRMALSGRGKLVGAYCIVSTGDGKPLGLSRIFFEEIELLRRDTPAWRNWEGRMVLRSAVKRAFSLLPKGSTEMRLIEELDSRAESGQAIDDLVGAPTEISQ